MARGVVWLFTSLARVSSMVGIMHANFKLISSLLATAFITNKHWSACMNAALLSLCEVARLSIGGAHGNYRRAIVQLRPCVGGGCQKHEPRGKGKGLSWGSTKRQCYHTGVGRSQQEEHSKPFIGQAWLSSSRRVGGRFYFERDAKRNWEALTNSLLLGSHGRFRSFFLFNLINWMNE